MQRAHSPLGRSVDKGGPLADMTWIITLGATDALPLGQR